MIYWHNYIDMNARLTINCGDPLHLEHPKTLQHTYHFLQWCIDIPKLRWTQRYQSAVETPTLRTSQDTTSTTCIFLQWLCFRHNRRDWYGRKVINQLWRPPHLKHPMTLQHTYLIILLPWSIDISKLRWTQKNQSAVETPTLITSQDTTVWLICVGRKVEMRLQK